MLRVVQATVARQLVRFLPVFASALAVALTCQAAVAAVRLARFSQRQRQVDEGQNVVHAVALLLRSAGGQNHRGLGLAQQVRRVLKLLFGNSR